MGHGIVVQIAYFVIFGRFFCKFPFFGARLMPWNTRLISASLVFNTRFEEILTNSPKLLRLNSAAAQNLIRSNLKHQLPRQFDAVSVQEFAPHSEPDLDSTRLINQ